jgi:phage terminase small subunit
MRPKPGRRTADDRNVIPLSSGIHRLQSPTYLDAQAREVFDEIVASCPESHFVTSDRELLATYCNALVVARRAARDVHRDAKALAVWERASRLIGQLSGKLRLCPSSRSDPKSVARASGDYRPSYYDLMRGRDEQA